MKFFRAILRILLWILGVFVLIVVTLNALDWRTGQDLVFERFVFGFWHFLAANIPSISWNAATWGPGLGAFLIATIFLHRWLSRWASWTGRRWSFATSFCLVSLVPVLFVISFIVPGVLLQWEALGESAWVDIR